MGKKTGERKRKQADDRRRKGRQSQEIGRAFEHRVAELYRLMHYDVEHGRLFSGRQVDIFLTGQFGDLTLYRAIECKVADVNADHVDSFIAKLRLVRREYPSAQGTVVSGSSFTDAIRSQAAQEGIQLTLYRDLAARLLDGHGYAKRLVGDCEKNDRYPMALYVEPFIGDEIKGDSEPARDFISEWLRDSEWNQLTLLGDVGTGKSFLARMLAYRLANSFLERPLENPLPILIDLRNADRQLSLEGLILTHLAQNGLERVSFDAFQHSLSQGNVVLILDGFDEMAARVTPQVTNRNFHELARCVKGRAKVLLTCRTHYFRSRTEEEEVVLGSSRDYGSETARDLYWDLVARKGFRIAYLRPFEISQIEEYVERAKPEAAKEALRKIRNTYNLMELSQRPLLLEMIVKSIDKLKAGEINPATLYTVYTDAWVHRDQWRDVLSPEAKLSFLMGLAKSLWQEDALTIHHTRLTEHVHQELAAQIQNPQHLIEIDSEIRTASFLTRDDSGHYGFAHKSYGEFFIARYLALHLKMEHLDCFHIRRLSPEIVGFLRHLAEPQSVEPLLERTLCDAYRPLISENALLSLYGFRRDTTLNRRELGEGVDAESLVVSLPRRVRLGGAQLDQVSLEGAVLKEADLGNANFSQAILAHADLSNANLNGANLEKAVLTHTCLRSALLSSSVLIGANLEGSDLSGADLSRSDLSDAYLLNVVLEDANLRDIKLTRAILSDELERNLCCGIADPTVRQKLEEEVALTTEQYWKMMQEVQRYIHAMARGPHYPWDWEDIAQEVSLKLVEPNVMEAVKKLDERKRREYIRAVVRDLYARRERREDRFAGIARRQGRDLSPAELADMIPSREPNPLESLLASESIAKEKRLFAQIEQYLSAQSLRIMKARYIEAQSIKEIAASEGMSERTVQRLITKSRELLRKYMASWRGEED